jgi:hypothetical protein
MDKFTRLTGIAAPLMRINIDTDVIIPMSRLVASAANWAVTASRHGATRPTEAKIPSSCSTSRAIEKPRSW